MARILVVDDDPISVDLLSYMLEDEHLSVSASSGEEAMAILDEDNAFDLVFLDFHMPQMSGLDALKLIKSDARLSAIPVIMVTASDVDSSIVAALDMGADDYVLKPFSFPVLRARMRASLRLREVREKLKASNQRLEILATTDSLTGLSNRRHFVEVGERDVMRAQRHRQNLIVAMLDIDFFKQINDTYGHDAGDNVLIKLAKKLSSLVRECDILARIGGEEFAVCMPQTSMEQACKVTERIRSEIEAMEISIGCGRSVKMTLSIGISQLQGQVCDLADLMKQADTALYEAKAKGRNQYVIYCH